jgi:RNA polymerase sigma factor (sigma-70 family)
VTESRVDTASDTDTDTAAAADTAADTAGLVTAADTAGLVTAAQAGDEAALAALISAHLPLVYHVIGRALDGHADVDDLVQETMLRVMRGLPGLREPERFRSWVTSIAYRQIQLHLRDRQKTLLRRQETPAELPVGDFAERTVTDLVLAEQRRELAEAARWLDGGHRHLLSLWWREARGELSRAELAAALTVSPKHAGVRLQRMKAQLDAARGMVRALHASPRCADLGRLVRTWPGEPDPVWRKRMIRHVRGCPRCQPHRRGLVPPEKLLFGMASLTVAAGLSADLPAAGAAPSIWAAIQNLCSSKIAAGAAAVTIAAGGGLAYTVHETPAPRADPPAAVRSTAGPPPAPTASARRPAPSAPARPPGAGGVTRADIYVAPGGSDSGTGTAERPYATLGKAVAAVRPGQTIALRGGTYRPDEGVEITTSGAAGRRITLSNYRDERPVIDASGVPGEWMVTHRASYWTVQGLEIKNSRSHAYVCRACRYNIFRRLSIHHNARSSLTLRDPGTVGNRVLDSDFFHNYDPDDRGRSGIGLAIKFGAGEGNLIRGNRAFNNADNGFDLGEFTSPVAVERNWAYGNGINRWDVAGWQSNADGFHLGGGDPPLAAAHVLRENYAWDNINSGFADAGNRGALQLSDNTAFRNGGTGFAMLAAAATLRGNAAIDNTDPASVGAGTTLRGNTWEAGGRTAAMFRSIDPRVAQGPRSADGTLPRTDFLTRGGAR